MKNRVTFFFLLLTVCWGCKKDNYPGSTISPYIAMYDIPKVGNLKIEFPALFNSKPLRVT